MPSEMLLFHKGLSYQARSALQEPGILRTCDNISLEKEGEQGLRPKFTAVNTTPVNAIHSIRRWGNNIVIGDSTYLRYRSILTNGDFTTIYDSFTNAIWRFKEFKEFLHGVNGTDEVLIDTSGNCYPAAIANPATKCAGAAGAAGNPSGHYMLYVSYYIIFPNGMTYETGLSVASADVSVSAQAISWSSIPLSTYAAYSVAANDAFNKCVLLLHFYDSAGSTTITDSAKNQTVTVAGDAKISELWSKFGGSSLLLDGTGDYAAVTHSTDFNFGADPFTIEFTVYLTDVAVDQGFFGKYQDASNYWYLKWTQATTTLQFKAVATTTMADYTAVWAPSASTEYHFSINRSGTSLKIFVNGTALTLTEATAIATNSMPATTSGTFDVGAANNHATVLKGYIDEVSVFKAIAKRSTTFTPPTVETTAPGIRRILYRGPGTGGTLSDIYYVGTIYDNTTTTYTDDASDATLAVSDASLVDWYSPLPNSHFIEYHYGRCFVIHDVYTNRLYFSEAATGTTAYDNEDIVPIATDYDVNWDDLRVSGFSATEPMGLVAWGTNFFIPLKQTWIRKQGNDPDTWSYKKTWAQYGVGASDTIAICPQPNGILSLSSPEAGNPGLTLFNGQISEMFSAPKLDYIFQSLLDQTYIANCRGFCAGRYYHLLFPSVDRTLTGIVFSNGTGDSVVGTYVDHGLITGTSTTVTGCTQAYANAAWTITVTGRNTFTLDTASWASFTGADVTGNATATISGTTDKWLAIDLRRYPDVRAAFWKDLKARCGCSYDQGGQIYIGTSDGYVKKSDTASTETINVDIETEDRIGGDIKAANTLKVLKELKYNLDTGSANVYLQIIIDGAIAVWPDLATYKTISGDGDEVQVIKSFPTNFQGYTYRVRVYGDALTTFKLYSPWEMIFDVKA